MSKSMNQNCILYIRIEDQDHPKLSRIKRIVPVEVGDKKKTKSVWLTWAAGLRSDWLNQRLESKSQVLILPPWPRGGFAGLPMFQSVPAPSNHLDFRDISYTVAATEGIKAGKAWKEEGLFSDTDIAWLVSYAPFIGAGRAWLCTAELLLANPNSWPKDMRLLLKAIVQRMTASIPSGRRDTVSAQASQSQTIPAFTLKDAPYLLAISIMEPPVTIEDLMATLKQKLFVEGDREKAKIFLEDLQTKAWLSKPLHQRPELAQVIDALGFRSYRLEIMENEI